MDLPLSPDDPEVGLGLWISVAGTFVVEVGVFAIGVGLYLIATSARIKTVHGFHMSW